MRIRVITILQSVQMSPSIRMSFRNYRLFSQISQWNKTGSVPRSQHRRDPALRPPRLQPREAREFLCELLTLLLFAPFVEKGIDFLRVVTQPRCILHCLPDALLQHIC
jgi:hypothetical protein